MKPDLLASRGSDLFPGPAEKTANGRRFIDMIEDEIKAALRNVQKARDVE